MPKNIYIYFVITYDLKIKGVTCWLKKMYKIVINGQRAIFLNSNQTNILDPKSIF